MKTISEQKTDLPQGIVKIEQTMFFFMKFYFRKLKQTRYLQLFLPSFLERKISAITSFFPPKFWKLPFHDFQTNLYFTVTSHQKIL